MVSVIVKRKAGAKSRRKPKEGEAADADAKKVGTNGKAEMPESSKPSAASTEKEIEVDDEADEAVDDSPEETNDVDDVDVTEVAEDAVEGSEKKE